MIGLGLGLGLGMNKQRGRPKPPAPSTRQVLVSAITDLKFVTLTYEGESLTFAPLVIYDLDGVTYVDGFLAEDTGNGNRPPALTPLVETDISQAQVTADAFSVHPRLWAILRRYVGVQSIVQRVDQAA